MGAVEQFFSGLGWGLVFLGLLSCVLPKCFKKGVLVMIAGDFFLMLAILFPRMFAELGIFKLNLGYRVVSYVIAVIVWGLFVVPSFLKWLRLRKSPQSRNCRDDAKEQVDTSDNSGSKLAPSSIFNSVKATKPHKDTAASLFSGVNREDH